jgi:hypothetical protein
LFKKILFDINLVILNDDNQDDLTFLTWFSFNKNFSGIKSLILKKKRTQSNINFWSNSFGIFSMVTDSSLEKINNYDFLDDSYFVVKPGIIFSKPELDLDKSIDLFDKFGLYYKNKNSNLFNEQNDLIGNLDHDVSTIFVNLNPWIDNLNKGKINNSLAKCYGHPEFLKGHGTANEVNFGFILKDAYSVYVNFPEVNYDR